MQPLVSVIIPTYNCENYILETINCILGQDYPAIELIVVDDGSTDKTQEIIESFGAKVKLLKQQNSGVCKSRNRGISVASGQFICLMDHDDYWFPNKISAQLKCFEDYPEAGVVYSSFTLWHADIQGKFPNPDNFTSSASGIDKEYSGWIYHLLLLDCWVLTSTAMFRSEVFHECGNFDEKLPFSEDWDLWLRISRSYQFLKINNITTLYRQHKNQGNKVVRPIDYRCNLLLRAYTTWGLCSPDGQCLTKLQFSRQLSLYHTEFGLSQLCSNGSLSIAIKSFLRAWLAFPLNIKSLAYLFAAIFGWQPNW